MNVMRKRSKCCLGLILLVAYCILCLYGIVGMAREDHFGFEKSEFVVVEEIDTHGGLHGDGIYYLTLDCSQNVDTAHEIIEGWKSLPLSKNLKLLMYGEDFEGESHGAGFAKEAHWPRIYNGMYKFIDRHPEATNQLDDTDLLNRYSYNFSVAVYDLDTDFLYYYEIDT